jgi:hypothetical protein
VLLALAAFTLGCGAESQQAEAPEAPSEDYAAPSVAGGAGEPQAPADGTSEADLPRMIIYTADLDLVVKDTVATQERITERIAALDGYVSHSQSYTSGEGLVRIDLTLRVPAEAFNTAMAELRAMALEVRREGIDTQDVTQEYVDLESRLGALEAKADRLEVLMEQAEDTEAVLAVYEELSETQQEIEQTKGRMRYLERRAALATITVQLTPDELSQPVEVAGWRPRGTVKRAIEALINTFQFLFNALIWFVLLVLPVVGFVGLLLFGFIRLLGLIFRGRKRERAPASEAESQTTAS